MSFLGTHQLGIQHSPNAIKYQFSYSSLFTRFSLTEEIPGEMKLLNRIQQDSDYILHSDAFDDKSESAYVGLTLL